jgi:ribose transport system substrate-binding protein
VREGLQAAAARHPELNLIVRDNDLNSEKALAHAQEFADMAVDLAIIFHIDERVGPNLRGILTHGKPTPIIAVDIPIQLTTFFGVNNQLAGLLAGEALGTWIQQHWEGQVDRILMLTEARVLNVVRQRLDYGLKKLGEMVTFDTSAVLYLDSGNRRDISAQRVGEVLARWSDYHRIAAICLNDDSALGVLDAARVLGREQDVAVVGQGANLAVEEFRNPGTRMIASTAYYPEQYGEKLIELSLRMLQGERVPPNNYVEPVLVTAENFG